MSSHMFNFAKGEFMKGNIAWESADLRIVPLMSNTTADTENDGIDTVSNISTLDEFDGSGYSSGGAALDSAAVTVDDANDRAIGDAADEDFGVLGAGTRAVQGMLLILFDTTLGGSMPIAWLEYASNKTMDGSDFICVFPSTGLVIFN